MNAWLDHPENRNRAAMGIIALGAFFLFNQWLGLFDIVGGLWPLFVVAPGAAFLYFAFRGDTEQSGLVFPGAIITGTGLILLYQNLTGDWASWAYVWALYPAMVGLALRYHGERTGEHEEIQAGREMVRWGLIAFGVGFVFFELVIFGGFGNFGLLLIAAGVAWMLYNGGERRIKVNAKPKRGDDDTALV